MEFLFKLKIYLLIFGYLFLQGCQTTNYNANNAYKYFNLNNDIYSLASDEKVCQYSYEREWKGEARRRGLSCEVINNKIKTIIASNQTKELKKRPLSNVSDTSVCYNATIT